MNAPLQLSRRDLLKGSSVLVVAFSLPPHMNALAQDAAAATKPVSLDQVDSFLAIDDKGMVTLYAGKVDLGTGVNIGLAQIVAEELDVRLANVSLVTGDTALTPDQGPTYGSQSIQTGGMQIRQAAAIASNSFRQEITVSVPLNVAGSEAARAVLGANPPHRGFVHFRAALDIAVAPKKGAVRTGSRDKHVEVAQARVIRRDHLVHDRLAGLID